jgi:SAM-dependent methyltransferase
MGLGVVCLGVRIELLGPSAVGKSTLLSAVLARGKARGWLGPGDVESKPAAAELRAAMDEPGIRAFVRHCVDTAGTAEVAPSQLLAMLMLLRKSCFDTRYVAEAGAPVVHDELLLHRAFSLLPHARDPERAGRDFFKLAPVPEAAVVFRADPETILERIKTRGTVPNVYHGLDDAKLRATVERCVDLADLAAEALKARDVDVLVLDTGNEIKRATDQLEEFIVAHTPDDIRTRLRGASGSFRKKDGRHELRTKNVMYCAFSTPNFTVAPKEAQRDAGKRVAHFGLTAENVRGKSVLDLGSNAGAMLFQLSNFAPRAGLGIEYDRDKVDLANEIAAHAAIPDVRFEQGDLDKLTAAEIGVHDIVLALAIEGHVNNPERLYRLLGEVTGEMLCFEGNSNCDMAAARKHLKAAGFTRMVDLGFCDDDRDPRNNRRPQLLARKRRRLFLSR